MRYLLVLIDGLADLPQSELGGKTPLEAANTPAIDKLALAGRLGTIRTVPKGQAPETLAALFTILGYPPGPYLTGRGYYEALASGIVLADGEWAFRLQFVTVADGKIVDTRAGGLTDDEGAALLKALEGHFNNPKLRFIKGHGHNHLLVVEGTDFEGSTTVNPFNVLNLPTAEGMPEGPGSEVLRKLIEDAPLVLAKHEINRIRLDLKQNPANAIWPWGGGTAVDVPGFQKTFGLEATLVSYSPLFRGVAVAAGIQVVAPGGAVIPRLADPSGRLKRVEVDNLESRASETEEIKRICDSTLSALNQDGLVMAHFSYPDEHSHRGDTPGKVKSIELIDRYFFKPVLKVLDKATDVRLTVVPTLMSRVDNRQHDDRPVPFMMWGPGFESRSQLTLTEANAEGAGIKIDDGTRLIDYVMNGL